MGITISFPTQLGVNGTLSFGGDLVSDNGEFLENQEGSASSMRNPLSQKMAN